jgi:hypothetical protein
MRVTNTQKKDVERGVSCCLWAEGKTSRTGQFHLVEMLIIAFGIIAYSPRSFVNAERLVNIDVVAEGQRPEAPLYLLEILWMIAISLKML